jgi:hypothetical protein
MADRDELVVDDARQGATTNAPGSADRVPAAIAGSVVESRSGLPLDAVRVRWLAAHGHDPAELAAGVTDRDGAFALGARRRLCRERVGRRRRRA